MFQNLDILSNAQAMARHAGARQALVAQNIANASTPGYKARDITPFAEELERGGKSAVAFAMTTTRPGHSLGRSGEVSHVSFADLKTEQSPDGNTVAIETEMLKSIEAERQHSRAITIYQSSLNILRTSIGRGR